MNQNSRSARNTSIDGFIRPTKSALPPNAKIKRQPIFPGQATTESHNFSPLSTTKPIDSSAFPARYYQPVQPVKAAPIENTKSAKPWKKRFIKSGIVVVAILLIVGGWLGSKILGNIDKVFHGNVFSDAHAFLSQTTLKGERQGRVNILLAGNSADDPGHSGANLTDSIMVVSIDTVHHTGFILSIPRDTWVYIPGLGHQKINAANEVTNFKQSGYPNGGMGQLESIITNDFGIPIDYYSLINYSALRDSVNAVGGIPLNIQSTDPRGLYDPSIDYATHGPLVKLTNGLHSLNGQQALDLARARGDAYGSYGFPQSDFDRTQHQRQMLTALEQKAASAGVLSNPLKVGQLFDSLGGNVHTDLNLASVLRFVQLTKGMNVQNLQSVALSNSGSNTLLTNYTAPDGEAALAPKAGIDDFSQIEAYYQQLISANPMTKESPSVVVLNASNVVGLAHKEEVILQSKGFTVAGTADANSEYPTSMIVDNTNGKKPGSSQALQKLFSTNTNTVTSTSGSAEAGEATGYNADFVVVLGQNWTSSTTNIPTTQP